MGRLHSNFISRYPLPFSPLEFIVSRFRLNPISRFPLPLPLQNEYPVQVENPGGGAQMRGTPGDFGEDILQSLLKVF